MTLALGIETATTRLSVALGTEDGIVASISIDGDRRHVEVLAPTIRSLCDLARITLSDLDLVAVDCGPGLFTGMRVGIATAQGLCIGLGVTVVPVRSVDVVAHPLRHGAKPVVVVIDARRGEVFRALYRGGAAVADIACTTPAAVAAEIAELGPCLAVGDGAVRHRSALESAGDVEVLGAWPEAAAVVELALSALGSDPAVAVDPALLQALYLREADARPNFAVARS